MIYFSRNYLNFKRIGAFGVLGFWGLSIFFIFSIVVEEVAAFLMSHYLVSVGMSCRLTSHSCILNLIWVLSTLWSDIRFSNTSTSVPDIFVNNWSSVPPLLCVGIPLCTRPLSPLDSHISVTLSIIPLKSPTTMTLEFGNLSSINSRTCFSLSTSCWASLPCPFWI